MTYQADPKRVKGMIFGHAVGDALGVPVEFVGRGELKSNPVTGMQGHGTYDMPAGAWSDDTSMTLCLLEALTRDRRGDYRGLMERFLRWKNEGAYTPTGVTFDMGGATRRALLRFEAGTDPLCCGGDRETDNGNGALMRIAPLVPYLFVRFGSHLPAGAMEFVHDIASLTHRHPRSLIACGIYVCIAVQLLRGRSPRKAVWIGYRHAREYYQSANESFRKEWKIYDRLRDNDAFAALPEREIRSSGYVVDTLEAALWCLLTTTSYEACVKRAVNLGEDTDTVAAIAGSLAGLTYGFDAIPEDWLKVLLKREELMQAVEAFLGTLVDVSEEEVLLMGMGKEDLVRGILSDPHSWGFIEEWQGRYGVTNYSDYWGKSSLSADDLTERLREDRVSRYDEFQCQVLFTTLLREDHWNNGAWEKRWEKGEPQRVLRRMLAIWGEYVK